MMEKLNLIASLSEARDKLSEIRLEGGSTTPQPNHSQLDEDSMVYNSASVSSNAAADDGGFLGSMISSVVGGGSGASAMNRVNSASRAAGVAGGKFDLKAHHRGQLSISICQGRNFNFDGAYWMIKVGTSMRWAFNNHKHESFDISQALLEGQDCVVVIEGHDHENDGECLVVRML